ncbi:MAG: hypothetical protein EPN31_10000 [Castellaniella sp.]|uniref:hypothetical protein n=1 Tax=Castellaniella sp. TaxID=1955812 RepID=UPI0011FBDBEB|nr:hypothetical protein [Castellaniella sp.]TAN27720.1 MAG: hypothetical protein EPN31_10000 [Castellaniella sp.]
MALSHVSLWARLTMVVTLLEGVLMMKSLRKGGLRAWSRGAVLALSLAALTGCSTTGESFQSAGLDRIVAGRTTFAQAVEDLGTEPVDTWQQGDTLLARWAYKGTVATDAVYFRQEVWLRFGPDGRFVRTERAINVPLQYHTRTAAEADRQASVASGAPVGGVSGTPAGSSSPVSGGDARTMAIPVPPYPAGGAAQ